MQLSTQLGQDSAYHPKIARSSCHLHHLSNQQLRTCGTVRFEELLTLLNVECTIHYCKNRERPENYSTFTAKQPPRPHRVTAMGITIAALPGALGQPTRAPAQL
jgi:hypothetical protein